MGSRLRGPVTWLYGREVGDHPGVGQASHISSTLYNAVQVTNYWDPVHTTRHAHHGGIFNFDFSTDGSVLVAACEKKSFLLFDPFNGKLIDGKTGAHSDCVNCVRFLDTRTFATCSDDTTVALWDLRCLRSKVRSLQGHSNWVKNIEYASSTGQLVTSGFDGTIYTWDINNYSDQDGCKRVFYASGLMRSKLTPDDSKLIIATAGGYLLIIHNLDLEHLNTDMEGFKPHMYRLMQISGTAVNTATAFNHMFERRRNRVELIGDFPKGNKAEVIASLQVHPQGWCVSSRNTSSDEGSEWTCVHDIHDQPLSKEDESGDRGRVTDPPSTLSQVSTACVSDTADLRDESSVRTAITAASHLGGLVLPLERGSVSVAGHRQEGRVGNDGEGEEDDDDEDDEDWLPLEDEVESRGESPSGTSSSSDDVADNSGEEGVWLGRIPSDLWGSGGFGRFLFGGGNPSGVDGSELEQNPLQPPVINGLDELNRLLRATQQQLRELVPETHNATGDGGREGATPTRGNSSASVDASPSSSSRTVSEYRSRLLSDLLDGVSNIHRRNLVRRRFMSGSETNTRQQPAISWSPATNTSSGTIHPIKPRLLYYLREPNVGRGYIKEQCFSTDGRLIVSPFGNGVRLLSFDSSCRELCDCEPVKPNHPRVIHELRSVAMHAHVALTTRFSPTHCLFVSGSLDGSVAFLQPYL